MGLIINCGITKIMLLDRVTVIGRLVMVIIIIKDGNYE